MRHTPLHSTLFSGNREKLKHLITPNCIAIFCSNHQFPSNADAMYPYLPNSDLYYLTGIMQEDTLLLLNPSAEEEKYRTILFIKETNETIAIWEGEKLTKAKASELSGIESIYWTHEFDQVLNLLAQRSEGFLFNLYDSDRHVGHAFNKNHDIFLQTKEKYPLHTYGRIASSLHGLRMVKAPQEVAALQTAIDITHKGLQSLLPSVQAGQFEYELEAHLSKSFLEQGAQGFGYEPIIASGKNACILHYIENNQRLEQGDLILMDIGAKYAGYNADLSRCIPVSGQFSKRQAQVYQAVLDIKQNVIKMCEPGLTFKELNKETGMLMESALIDLKLLSAHEVQKQNNEYPLYKKYFMHGIGHHLGLDVHDVGDNTAPLKEGMVITVEPGIYIKEEGLGIRIENNIIITEDGAKDLMADIPVEIDAIENLMNK